MNIAWIIARRELKSFFDSLLAYIILIVFLGFTGFFTWLFGRDIFLVGEASLQSFFGVAYWTLFFFIPALTMRLLAEEKHSGTIEIILTKPVNEWQFVFGKFISIFLLVLLSLGLTLPYYITLSFIGPVDHGAVLTGYLGLLLLSSTYISIGIFASSLTNNQIVSFLLALIIGIFFHLLFGMLSNSFPGVAGNVLDYLSASAHYESVVRGVIDTKDIIYFAGMVFAGLVGAEAVLMRRNITDNA